MCDVIKIRLKRRDATRIGKRNQSLNIKTSVEQPILKLGLPNFSGSFYSILHSFDPSFISIKSWEFVTSKAFALTEEKKYWWLRLFKNFKTRMTTIINANKYKVTVTYFYNMHSFLISNYLYNS